MGTRLWSSQLHGELDNQIAVPNFNCTKLCKFVNMQEIFASDVWTCFKELIIVVM